MSSQDSKNILPSFLHDLNSRELFLFTRIPVYLLDGFISGKFKPNMPERKILSLSWENVNLSKRCIHIEDSKSGRSRNVPMNNLVIEALSVIPQNSEYVFLNSQTGKPIKDVKTTFKKTCEKSKIKGLRFHDLRHMSATKMIEIGVLLVTVSKILGHSSIQMTMRYAHPTPENMKKAVDKLGEIFEEKLCKKINYEDVTEAKKSIIPLILDN